MPEPGQSAMIQVKSARVLCEVRWIRHCTRGWSVGLKIIATDVSIQALNLNGYSRHLMVGEIGKMPLIVTPNELTLYEVTGGALFFDGDKTRYRIAEQILASMECSSYRYEAVEQ